MFRFTRILVIVTTLCLSTDKNAAVAKVLSLFQEKDR